MATISCGALDATTHSVIPAESGTDLVAVCGGRSGRSSVSRYNAGEVADDQREHDADDNIACRVASTRDRPVEQLVADATGHHHQ
jgi:hypothetical protein